ncbi:hypothetical protein PYCC9005_005467 [Savitreella phatthalungensis]
MTAPKTSPWSTATTTPTSTSTVEVQVQTDGTDWPSLGQAPRKTSMPEIRTTAPRPTAGWVKYTPIITHTTTHTNDHQKTKSKRSASAAPRTRRKDDSTRRASAGTGTKAAIKPLPKPSPLAVAQVEYYFSIDNLCKDVYLRSHMDDAGFVDLEVLAGFNRLRAICPTVDGVKRACEELGSVEVLEGKVRTRNEPERWVLPLDQRVRPSTDSQAR